MTSVCIFPDVQVSHGNDVVVVELKVAQEYNSKDETQLLNELKATRTRVGLLINFGREKVEFKRLVL
jgi:GxxExxY protein